MRPENAIALKEWASVCAALASGTQSLLLRKGGIAEGPSGFHLDHDEFWLFPTQFHQSPDQLTPAGAEWLQSAAGNSPSPGQIPLSVYVVVKAVTLVRDERSLEELSGWHILSDEVVRSRFHYRRPGLSVAAVEVWRRASAHEVKDEPRFAGCHSWVELADALSTSALEPVQPIVPVSEVTKRVLALA